MIITAYLTLLLVLPLGGWLITRHPRYYRGWHPTAAAARQARLRLKLRLVGADLCDRVLPTFALGVMGAESAFRALAEAEEAWQREEARRRAGLDA